MVPVEHLREIDGLLTMLDTSYFKVSYGNQEPDLLLATQGMKDRLGFERFNNADVRVDAACREGTWMFLNTKHPKEPRYSGMFTKDLNWQPVPREVMKAHAR